MHCFLVKIVNYCISFRGGALYLILKFVAGVGHLTGFLALRGGNYLNKPSFKSSNAWEEDVEVLN